MNPFTVVIVGLLILAILIGIAVVIRQFVRDIRAGELAPTVQERYEQHLARQIAMDREERR